MELVSREGRRRTLNRAYGVERTDGKEHEDYRIMEYV